MNKEAIQGHMSAFLTILIWGTTFISTKLLLKSFVPIEILFYRFLIGFLVLCLIDFKAIHIDELKNEILFAAAGLSGITLYYLLENIALIYSTASNVGIIISIAPFFTGILSRIVLKKEKLGLGFYLGFIVAMSGITLMSFNVSFNMKFNCTGDILAVLAAAVWAVYSILTKKISAFGYTTIESTKKIFFYGLLFMIPILKIFKFKFGIYRFTAWMNFGNILFLGLCASALCFVTWNTAVKKLGPVKTSIYIYTVPIITVITSVIILNEKITCMNAVSILITLCGVFISNIKLSLKK